MITKTATNALLKQLGAKNPDRVRLILYGAGVAVIGTFIFIKIRKWKKTREAKKYGAEEFAGEIMGIKINANNTTISSGDAIIIAQNILNAMDRWGTDEDAIIDNLNRLKTKDDLLLVIQKFGMKMYDGMVLADDPIARFFGTILNMQGWLRRELGRRDTERVKAIYDKLGVPF
jgi:hypothetical protein